MRVEGFTGRIRDWLAASDLLIHATGGLTVFEALMQGCPAISYGWGRGHLRINNAAYRRFGLADVVGERDQLAPAIVGALERPRARSPAFDKLPSAASLILAGAENRPRRHSGLQPPTPDT